MRTCDLCGAAIAAHDPPIVIQMVIGTDGADLYPDEVAQQASPFVAAAFATTPGIGGVRLTYGEPCFRAHFTPSGEEVQRLEALRVQHPERPAARTRRSPFASARGSGSAAFDDLREAVVQQVAARNTRHNNSPR